MTEKITGIEGPMFSSKTLELIQHAERLTIAGERVQVFQPVVGVRKEGPNVIKSRFGGEWKSTVIEHPYAIKGELEEGVGVVIVDGNPIFRPKK